MEYNCIGEMYGYVGNNYFNVVSASLYKDLKKKQPWKIIYLNKLHTNSCE